MTAEPEVAGRLQRALDAFQKAKTLLLAAHRKLKGLSSEEVDRFWRAPGARLEEHSRYATSVAPRLAAAWLVSPLLTVRASGGRGYRVCHEG